MFEEYPYCRSCGRCRILNYTDLNGMYKNKSWLDMFCECAGIDITKDTFSRILCEECSEHLLSSYKFRSQSQKTNEKLIEHLGNIEIKEEIDEHLGPIDKITPVEKTEDLEQTQILVKPFDIGIPTWSDEDDEFISEFSSSVKVKHTPKTKPKSTIDTYENDDGIQWNGYLCLGNGCYVTFDTFSELNKHYEEMKGSECHFWQCDLCNRSFESKQSIHNHIKRLHKESPCSRCDEVFTGNYNLLVHCRKFHKTPKSETCILCKKVFATRRFLKIHTKCVHEKEMNYSCHYCGRKMFSKINLINHFRVHTDERPFQCSIEGCDKRFKQRGQLIQHELTHNATQNYSCDVCGIKIKSRYYLSEHRKIHFYDAAFKCDMCDMTFARPSYVREHKKHRHTVEAPVVCPECGKTFKSQKNLNTHLNIHRETEHVCPQCNKMFPRRQLLKEHILATHDQIRKWICAADGCDKAYYRSSHLRHHEKVVHMRVAYSKFAK